MSFQPSCDICKYFYRLLLQLPPFVNGASIIQTEGENIHFMLVQWSSECLQWHFVFVEDWMLHNRVSRLPCLLKHFPIVIYLIQSYEISCISKFSISSERGSLRSSKMLVSISDGQVGHAKSNEIQSVSEFLRCEMHILIADGKRIWPNTLYHEKFIRG